MIRFSAILAQIILRAAAWGCFAAAWGLALLDCARSIAFSRLSFAPLSAVWTQFYPGGAAGALPAGRMPAFMAFLLAGLILFYLSLMRLYWRQPWLHLRRRLRRLWPGAKAAPGIGDKFRS